jgi:hypothetical protein
MFPSFCFRSCLSSEKWFQTKKYTYKSAIVKKSAYDKPVAFHCGAEIEKRLRISQNAYQYNLSRQNACEMTAMLGIHTSSPAARSSGIPGGEECARRLTGGCRGRGNACIRRPGTMGQGRVWFFYG